MDHFREIKNTLSWHSEGRFDVELTNGIITKLNFCEPGKGPDDAGKCLTSTNYKFLQAVHSCLGELFTFIDEENKRLGYSFAKVVEIPKARVEEPVESFYPVAGETRLRSLVKYDHQPVLDGTSSQVDNLIRDIG